MRGFREWGFVVYEVVIGEDRVLYGKAALEGVVTEIFECEEAVIAWT